MLVMITPKATWSESACSEKLQFSADKGTLLRGGYFSSRNFKAEAQSSATRKELLPFTCYFKAWQKGAGKSEQDEKHSTTKLVIEITIRTALTTSQSGASTTARSSVLYESVLVLQRYVVVFKSVWAQASQAHELKCIVQNSQACWIGRWCWSWPT